MSHIVDTHNFQAPGEAAIQEHAAIRLTSSWMGCARNSESTLHQVSPYIGKMKSTIGSALVHAFTSEGQTIYDPFCGSGTIALEGWRARRNVVATDLSPYAVTLTQAKLYPCLSLKEANEEMGRTARKVTSVISDIDLRRVPKWVRAFYQPDTLRETIAWVEVLKARKSYFLLACLLGILHHQRPGFLSYPSSHTVPYLRGKKFPRELYPELYEYRSVKERLEKKVIRALKRLPLLDTSIYRTCSMQDATSFTPKREVAAIITSPPYMRQLDYGRDNRLRLWFLGTTDWNALDQRITPSETQFVEMMKLCLQRWHKVLVKGGTCILALGDTYSKSYGMRLPDVVVQMATKEIGGYKQVWKHTEMIPDRRRVRHNCKGIQHETVLVLSRTEG
jgi:hypothetical protein